MVEKEADILIIGGGLIGAALMLALAKSPYRVLLVESKPFSNEIDANFDARTLALSPASMRILQMLDIWSDVEPYSTAIHRIHVSEKRRFGTTRLEEKKNSPLGYVVEMQHLFAAMYPKLSQENICAPAKLTALYPSQNSAIIQHGNREIKIKARLIVAADGTHSFVRQLCNLKAKIKNFNQHAIIANIGLARSHHGCAYERFTASGPLALLPMSGERAALVWSLTPTQAEQLMHLSDKEFLKALQDAFGYRLGRFTKVGQRVIFPLQQVLMPQQAVWPFVFVGNAAHTLHPVAGQGFNLSLRDIALLAQCLVQKGLKPEALQTYQQLRQHDQTAITFLTNSLVELFKHPFPGIAPIRGLGLMALDNLSLLKNLLAHYARGFAGLSPDLVCGIPLNVESQNE